MKEVKEYHPNRQIKYHFWLNEKGKFEGEYKGWHSNGQLAVHCFYKNGLKEGEYKSWWDNGQLVGQGFFKNGYWDGEYKSWYSNGQLEEHRFYHNDKEVDITDYAADINNITEEEYFLLQMTFGYFPIFKFDGKL